MPEYKLTLVEQRTYHAEIEAEDEAAAAELLRQRWMNDSMQVANASRLHEVWLDRIVRRKDEAALYMGEETDLR